MSSIIAIIITIIITLIIIIIYSKLLSWFYRLPLEGEKFFFLFFFSIAARQTVRLLRKFLKTTKADAVTLFTLPFPPLLIPPLPRPVLLNLMDKLLVIRSAARCIHFIHC